MADDDDEVSEVEDFEEEEAEVEGDPEEIDEDALDEDFEELDEDDEMLGDEDGLSDEDELEEDDEPEPTTPRRRASEDEDEDEDLLAPDDVEADLDTILKDRLVTADETNEDEDEEAEVDERGGDGDRLQPKRPDEQLCQRCFLLVRRNAPNCPVGDDDCPLFT